MDTIDERIARWANMISDMATRMGFQAAWELVRDEWPLTALGPNERAAQLVRSICNLPPTLTAGPQWPRVYQELRSLITNEPTAAQLSAALADCTTNEDVYRVMHEQFDVTHAGVISQLVDLLWHLHKTQPSFHQQVQAFRAAQAKKAMDGAAGFGEGQYKKALAADKVPVMLAEAKRVARELAANGPITIDHVTERMSGKFNVLSGSSEKAQNWKGKVFGGAEWVVMRDDVPARQKSSHGRHVKLWALKSWADTHDTNGQPYKNSAFILTRIMSQFKRQCPGVDLSMCRWFIGVDKLSNDIKTEVIQGKGMLYGVPVSYVDGIGAILMPPLAVKAVLDMAAKAYSALK